MKLYFLRRTELAGRTVAAFRTAEAGDAEAAGLIEDGTAIRFGEKRAQPRPALIKGRGLSLEQMEFNQTRRKACRAAIETELNQIVFDRFPEFYGMTNPKSDRATRVATAVELMRFEAYPYFGSAAEIRRCSAWNRALFDLPPKTFSGYIPMVNVFAEDKKHPGKKKKIGERYLY